MLQNNTSYDQIGQAFWVVRGGGALSIVVPPHLIFSLSVYVCPQAYLPLSRDEDIQLLAIFHLGALQPTAISPLQPSSLGDKTGLIAVGFHSGVVKFVRFDWSV